MVHLLILFPHRNSLECYLLVLRFHLLIILMFSLFYLLFLCTLFLLILLGIHELLLLSLTLQLFLFLLLMVDIHLHLFFFSINFNIAFSLLFNSCAFLGIYITLQNKFKNIISYKSSFVKQNFAFFCIFLLLKFIYMIQPCIHFYHQTLSLLFW